MLVGIVSYPNNPKQQNYVRWLQECGATPVEITPHFPLKEIQAVVWVGGSLETMPPSAMHTFLATLRKTFVYAVAENKKGVSFPILGICLGFQLLALVRSGNLTAAANHTAKTVRFRPSALASAVSNKTGKFNHNYSLRPPYPLYLEPLSEETDARGSYLTSFQFKKYPFYGTLWHPERSNEFGRELGVFFLKQIKKKRASATFR